MPPVSNLTIGRFVTGSYFYSQYRQSDREWDDKALFAAKVAALLGAERALMSGVGAVVRTPYFWAAAAPVALGAAISYAIDEGEGLANYEEFMFGMDLHEKIQATAWAGDQILKDVVVPNAIHAGNVQLDIRKKILSRAWNRLVYAI